MGRKIHPEKYINAAFSRRENKVLYDKFKKKAFEQNSYRSSRLRDFSEPPTHCRRQAPLGGRQAVVGSVSRGRVDKLRPVPAVQGPGSAPLRPPHRGPPGFPRPWATCLHSLRAAGVLCTSSPGAALTSEEPKKRVLVPKGSSFQVARANPSSPAGPRAPSCGFLRSHRALYQALAQLSHSLPNYFRAILVAFAWLELFTGEAGVSAQQSCPSAPSLWTARTHGDHHQLMLGVLWDV